MNTRRKFLKSSGIVASAVLAFDPFSSMASSTIFSADADSTVSASSVVLLHTTHYTAEDFLRTAAGTGALAARADNIILLNTSTGTSRTLPQAQEQQRLAAIAASGYGAVLAAPADVQAAGNGQQRYAQLVLSNAAHGTVQASRTVTKGNIKIGIIGTAALQAGAADQQVQELSTLAKKLKDDGCKLVVCLSSLGYTTTGTLDDARLAAGSEHIDVIISGGNTERIKPHVVLTHTGNEVLIDNAGSAATGVGRLEIGFDASGSKNYVAFGSQVLSGAAEGVAVTI